MKLVVKLKQETERSCRFCAWLNIT